MAGIVGESDNVELIGRKLSPYVIRARIALNLKRVKYEFLEEAYGAPKSELLLKSNPVYKKIPVLLHGGRPICESMIIVQYIDEVWTLQNGSAILSRDPYERSIHRFWAFYVDDKWIHSIISIALRRHETEASKAEAAEQVLHGLKLLEEAFEKCSSSSSSKGKAFFGGDTVGYLDISLGSWLGWLRVSERVLEMKLLGEEKTPLLAGWAERFCAHEAVKEVMPGIDELMEFRNIRIMEQQALALHPPQN